MSETVIKVENLSKLYRLGEVGTGTISHDLNRWWARVRGKEDPFAKVGSTNDRTLAAAKGEYVYALKDINFEVKQGEVLGIIGKNGAGKSTLLKILSRITSPTTGHIKAKGRIASLLEVGTGMHPEMTGKENVYLNGTILGMTKREIDKKYEEIMDFAGCLKYADTPVKRYSSGMKVRLGFAVAAFLEPEILIVDEVLAVGDAEFQKKAIGKMQDISSGGGRTVLFVSHNMGSVSAICKKCMVLENGKIFYNGATDDAIERYLKGASHQVPIIDTSDTNVVLTRSGPQKKFRIKRFELLNHFGNPNTELLFGKSVSIKITFEVKEDVNNAEIGAVFTNGLGVVLGGHLSNWNGFKKDFKKGNHEVLVSLPFLYLMPGQYSLSTYLKIEGTPVDDQISHAIEFTVIESLLNGNKAHLSHYKHLNLTMPSNWKALEINE